MKRVLLILVAGAFISTSVISCTKACGRCHVNNTVGSKTCSTSNHIVYDAAVTSCATGGGTWVTE